MLLRAIILLGDAGVIGEGIIQSSMGLREIGVLTYLGICFQGW